MKRGFDGRPVTIDGREVVLVHLPLSRAHPDLAVCSFEPFTPADESVGDIPLMLCPACQRALKAEPPAS